MKNLSRLLCKIIILLLVISCSKQADDSRMLSSEKLVLSFSLNSLSPTVTGSIDQTGKTISVNVPFGTDLTALTPTITISANAAILPASGVAQNFTNAVNYIVIAEDGSKQVYTVK